MHKPVCTVGLDEQQRKHLKITEEHNKGHEIASRAEKTESIFHGKESLDYQGRSWLEFYGRCMIAEQCYIPKKLIHTWSGHQRGVQKILWFPVTAHLMLSAGLDGKVKIWDVLRDRRCMRTYIGHEKGVRDITFSNDGKTFISSSFDKSIKVWDTETGVVKRTINHDKIGYVVRIHPDDNKQNMLLVGCSDRNIYQYDLDTGDLVQEYDRHLDAVNTITFINNNRFFLTTSDDKTIRIWEFGIPNQIKYIADPSMHSMPYVSIVPNGRWILMQNMDNTIHTYGVKDRISLNKKKIFKGHSNAGYACQVGVSPNGRYVLSGDGEGRCYFWDWKTARVTRSIRAHHGACIGALWHPYETSRVATCGSRDALIKLWD
jgi:pre-mRNA-processing factor 17